MIIKLFQRQNSIQIKYSSSVQIERLSILEFSKSSSNMNNIYNLTSQSYEDPSYRIDMAIPKSTHIYLARRKDQYIGYVMVDFEFGLSVYNKEPLVCLILSCIDNVWKRSGILPFIFSYFVRDIQQYQRQTSKKVLIRYTTVTPFAMHAITNFFSNTQPKDDEHGGHGKFLFSGNSNKSLLNKFHGNSHCSVG